MIRINVNLQENCKTILDGFFALIKTSCLVVKINENNLSQNIPKLNIESNNCIRYKT